MTDGNMEVPKGKKVPALGHAGSKRQSQDDAHSKS